MSVRKEVIATGEVYHVFNRSIDKQRIFKNSYDYRRLLELIQYYQFLNTPVRYSHFNRLNLEQKEIIWYQLRKQSKRIVDIYAFCVMPNHFHFLMKPLEDNGLSDYMRFIQLGYAKYFNKKYHRKGVLFEGMFHAVRIEDDEQFVHVHRYILLNPVTAFLIKLDAIDNYPWSAYPYLFKDNFVNSEYIKSQFSSIEKYLSFLKDQENYQKELNRIKHLVDFY